MREICTHYCGRPSSYSRALGRPLDFSALGNPFPMRDESERKEVCNKYRVWLWGQMRSSPHVMRMLRDIPDDAVLGCFCAPRQCHCDDLKRAVEWLRAEKRASRDGKEGL